jgi:hypothetical protein
MTKIIELLRACVADAYKLFATSEKGAEKATKLFYKLLVQQMNTHRQ